MPWCEGMAVIRGFATQSHAYLVQFFGDPVLKTRVIHPALQENPGGILEALLTMWERDQSYSGLDDLFHSYSCEKAGGCGERTTPSL